MAKRKEMENSVPVVEEEIDELTVPKGTLQEEGDSAAADGDGHSVTLTTEEFESVRQHIEMLTKERDETIALLQRNQADFENYRRRNANISTDSYDEGKRDTIKQLLTVLDCFDRAIENADTEAEAWRDGVMLTIRQLREQLKKLGLEAIQADGMFDPAVHEAVMQEAVEGKESGEILAVLQTGYRVGDRIIRHSMVKVAE